VAHYPRGKIVMTAPVQLPLVGQIKFSETTKEALIDFWRKIEHRTGIKINYREHMESIDKNNNGFIVKTSKATYETKTVLLAVGRRGTPRKLGVPGEEQPKVVYRLIDTMQYRNKNVLVVGGGNSALEAAATLAEEEGTTVTLSYRSNAFAKANPKNVEKVYASAEAGKLNLLLNSAVKQIDESNVILNVEAGELKIKNDAVIVCAGGVLPTPMLKSIGVEIETKHGTL
jgi:thioredoxin reductase